MRPFLLRLVRTPPRDRIATRVAMRLWRWPRHGGTAGDGALLLRLAQVPNLRLVGALRGYDLGSFLDVDPRIRERYLPVLLDPDYLVDAGYDRATAVRVRRYLVSLNPDDLAPARLGHL